ncbi:MAG TPA: S53 family serine peptidase [Verrucomicrobiae bacterium]|nr:S53 family serine peptidase [Verrucomicrobiae bacterium]
MKLEGIRSFLFLLILSQFVNLGFICHVQATPTRLLTSHVPGAIKELGLKPIGRLPAGQRLSVVIGLPMRNQAAFQQLLDQIYDPASPEYHHYLTPDEITDRFGPTETDYDTVIAFAKTNGLRIAGTHRGRTILTVDGTIADIEHAFHVRMLVYQHPIEARTFYAPDSEPSVNLSVPLLHVSGLNNFILPRPGGSPGSRRAIAGAHSGGGSGPGGAYIGQDYRAAYVPGTSLTGSGQSVGLLELDGYYTNDILSYEQASGLPNVVITNVLVDGSTGTPDSNGNWVGEVSLDMEMVISMAPGISRLIVYEAPNSSTTWVDILTQMQEDNAAKQLSSSWLFLYDDANADPIYQKFAMQGQSFYQCSGDDLAFYKTVGQWTDDPNVTLVGGTELATAADGSWRSETVWNNGDGLHGSGGGVSGSYMGNFTIPTWQTGINMTNNGGSTTKRNVPDVSMVAYNAWVAWDNGSTGWWWGTSIAAPLWAGFTALANQQAIAEGEPTLGFLNPALYAIGTGPLYSSCFHDVTTGNNTNSHSASLYYAVPGYDLCTGWGSPSGVNLINVLTQTPIVYDPVRNAANGSITLSSLCVPGSTNVVFAATNLAPPVMWQPISTNVASSAGAWQYADTNATNYKTRFYRIVNYLPGR